jgi:hypothetical protein
MLRLNAIFEAWLRESTEKPLASWKRAALLWRLQEDEALRCYAAELAQFTHEPEPSKAFGPEEQAWMRERLRARLPKVGTATPESDWVSALAGPVIGLTVGLSILALIVSAPEPVPESASQGASSKEALALTLPSPTATETPLPSGDLSAVKALAPVPTLTALP